MVSGVGPDRHQAESAETKHERTLSVRYVFRNQLICREEVERPLKPEFKDTAAAAGLGRRRMRLPNQQRASARERRHQGAILILHRCRGKAFGPAVSVARR